jgi:thiosulfate/3-mercaptopyruvate sulfurtransferase
MQKVWKLQGRHSPLTGLLLGGLTLSFLEPDHLYLVPGAPALPATRSIGPLVSPLWLSNNLPNKTLTALDIRDAKDYGSAHIPGSVNVPFSEWITTRDGLMLEVPEQHVLLNLIGSAGISKESAVVVINRAGNPFALADATRVAATLIYAGILNVSVLDGGYDKWIGEGREITDAAVTPARTSYTADVDEGIFVSADYVHKKAGKSLLLDARDPEAYFGLVQESTAARPGHIPHAKNLPAPWIWGKDGTYRRIEILQKMISGLVNSKTREIILYCGAGGYAAAWWYVLTQILGLGNVCIYDGSAQEWTANPKNPVVAWIWE